VRPPYSTSSPTSPKSAPPKHRVQTVPHLRVADQDSHAIVGLSLPRDGSFAGLKLDQELKARDAEPWCGVQIVSLNSGDIVEWIRLEGGVTELFDVRVLPGVRRPTATGFLTDEIHRAFTIEME
jgi:hypothetical protein